MCLKSKLNRIIMILLVISRISAIIAEKNGLDKNSGSTSVNFTIFDTTLICITLIWLKELVWLRKCACVVRRINYMWTMERRQYWPGGSGRQLAQQYSTTIHLHVSLSLSSLPLLLFSVSTYHYLFCHNVQDQVASRASTSQTPLQHELLDVWYQGRQRTRQINLTYRVIKF